jgi:uncharacterized membrane protein
MQITIADALGFISAITALLIALSTRRKTNAEREDLESQITERVLERAHKEMESMQKQIDGQQTEIIEVKAENRQLRAWVKLLCDQVVSLGGVPVPMPDKEK